MQYDLQCEFDARQSFYGKAKIEETKNKNIIDMKLYSYGTLVARITEVKPFKTFHYFGKYSQTTTRHQKEFFRQNGLTEKEINELFKKGQLVKEVY